MEIEPRAPPGDYRPGACNIGPREIAKRRAFGIAGIVSAVVLGVALVAVDAPPIDPGPRDHPVVGRDHQPRTGTAEVLRRVRVRRDPQRQRVRCHGIGRPIAADLAADRAAARTLVAYCGVIAPAIVAIFVLLPI